MDFGVSESCHFPIPVVTFLHARCPEHRSSSRGSACHASFEWCAIGSPGCLTRAQSRFRADAILQSGFAAGIDRSEANSPALRSLSHRARCAPPADRFIVRANQRLMQPARQTALGELGKGTREGRLEHARNRRPTPWKRSSRTAGKAFRVRVNLQTSCNRSLKGRGSSECRTRAFAMNARASAGTVLDNAVVGRRRH